MTDEQINLAAHLRRLLARVSDQQVPERTVHCLRNLVFLAEDMIAESPMAMQERARVLLLLMDPVNEG